MLTSNVQKRTAWVDYLIISLVYEIISDVKRIVGQKVDGIEERRELMVQCEAFIKYLKSYVKYHIDWDDD